VSTAVIATGKHITLMNAELDATIGPMLKVHADRAGAVITYTDGDEPGPRTSPRRERISTTHIVRARR